MTLPTAAQDARGSGEVKVISGGIGIGERESLQAAARDFNLKLVFVLSTGNYLADVPFEIVGASGKTVVTHQAAGPIAYAKLPPGTYRVKARLGASEQTRSVTVDRRGQRTLHFRWRGAADPTVAA